ncbi:hypothetical protein [Marinobacter nauticus]|uniref:Capsule polysaccharide biosynthesis protein n=1 Tax=Marinobacter nauticus TaxID=2743 RepID=A0A368UPJ7_MARNT|nr:hypothetical protein [Marinobacter nauticus]RBP69258.1 hypothetical protein DET64_11423 [Marinobacter nauticus]RCW30737.1 hypothetical protein DET51_11423 [Marinobacter nauticus]
MKFGFIENRYKTIFWNAVAEYFISEGHSICWLVQNPIFSPTVGNTFVIPFPGKKQLSECGGLSLENFENVKSGDRYINYFGGNDRHYQYYISEIRYWLDREKPDVVIGESTLFHELLTIEECRARGIPFFHPSMPGYPGGRYSIYAYDSKEPLGESDDMPSDEFCFALAEAIRKRERIPEYMIPPIDKDPERIYPLPNSFMNRITVLWGYLRGERFNTPSPLRKWICDRKVKNNLYRWQRISKDIVPIPGKNYVLYPMQMQPEANLDVWGKAYRDQTELISEIANSLPHGWTLLVKANPKAKYEIDSNLIELLNSHPKVLPIPLNSSMADVFEHVDLVITVTGTVATECVLSKKPVIQFGPGIVQNRVGCVNPVTTNDIDTIIQLIEAGEFSTANDSERVELVRLLYQTTFSGKVSDPATLPSVMSKDNVTKVASSILKVAAQQQCG